MFPLGIWLVLGGDPSVRNLGWSPASDSEAGGMYFRREGRILEGEGTGGGDASESRLGLMSGVWVRVCTPLFSSGNTFLVCS